MDKNSGISKDEIKNAVRPLEEKTIQIISVGVGDEVNDEELRTVTDNPDHVIKATKTVNPRKLGDSIMKKARKGRK